MKAFELEVDILDSRFAKLIQGTARVEQLYDGCRWAEGPVWFGDRNALIWSDVPNHRMLQWVEGVGVGVFRAQSNYSNGNTRDREGRLVTCEHGARRVTRTELDGSITVIADTYKGKRLNSPNDVVVKSDGTVWFTDPPYGILTDYEGYKSPQEQDGCYVYRVDPAKKGSIEAVVTDLEKPNGIAFSLDESILYVVDTGASHNPNCPRAIHAYPVKRGGKVGKGSIFAAIDAGAYDGFRLDTDGNIWTSAARGVNCYAPDGALLGRIKLPEVVSNVAFGGARRNRLFITATTSLYSVYVFANGALRP
ncbi:MAG: SMP-30/gluconolactonase/LRE family protein [Propylenella sp.]